MPVHYWNRWANLLEGGPSGLGSGIVIQAIWIFALLAAAWLVLRRRDPAA